MYTTTDIKMISSPNETPVYLVEITVDTAADIPQPRDCWAAGSKLEVLENGGSKYKLNHAREWVNSNFNKGGGGNSVLDVLEFKAIDESGRVEIPRSFPMGEYSPIVGHNAFYHASGYGFLTKIPFDTGEQTQLQMVGADGLQCPISVMAYGNGVYFGVGKQNTTAYKSTDCINWEVMYDVQIPIEEITSISFSNGDFYFGTTSGILGVALKSENYSRITDYSNMWVEVVEAGVLQNVFGRFGNQFFITNSCIISGHLGDGEIRRLAFLEEAPDDPYVVTTYAFWNNHLIIFDDAQRLIYAMPMRYPHDTGGNFIDPEWQFYGDDWRMELYPCGVCNVGENLLIFTDRHIFRIDKYGEISRLTTLELSLGNAQNILVGDKTILVYCGSGSSYQFFIN